MMAPTYRRWSVRFLESTGLRGPRWEAVRFSVTMTAESLEKLKMMIDQTEGGE